MFSLRKAGLCGPLLLAFLLFLLAGTATGGPAHPNAWTSGKVQKRLVRTVRIKCPSALVARFNRPSAVPRPPDPKKALAAALESCNDPARVTDAQEIIACGLTPGPTCQVGTERQSVGVQDLGAARLVL